MLLELGAYLIYQGVMIPVNWLNTVKGFNEGKDKLFEDYGVLVGKKLDQAQFDELEKGIDGFAGGHKIDEMLLEAKFSGLDTDFRTSLGTVLKGTLSGTSINEYKEAIKKARDTNPPRSPRAMISAVKEAKDNAVKAIQAQHALELKGLEAFLKDKFPGDSQADKKKEDIKKALLEAQKKQLEDFNNTTNKALKELHQQAQNEMNRIAFLAKIARDDPKMKEKIRIAVPSQPAAAPLTAILEQRAPTLDKNVAHIAITDLDEIKTKTGQTIKYDSKTGKYTMVLAGMLNPFGGHALGYFFGNKIEHDFQVMAEALKAQGKESVVVDVIYGHPDTAKLRAQQAFRACIEAGFPFDKITVKVAVGGKPAEDWTPDKIFGAGSSEILRLQQRAEEVKNEHDELLNKHLSPEEVTAQVRSEVQAAKAAAEQAAAAKKAAAPAAPPTGPALASGAPP